MLITLATIGAWAQNPFHTMLKDYKVVNTSSEQGRDRLDSTYYLHAQIYQVPRKSKKEVAHTDALVQQLVDTYNTQLASHTGGFCSSSDLSHGSNIESKQVSAYYGENLEPLVVGGLGRNYVLLRKQDPGNPNYRTVYGVEWWIEKPELVYFREFRLFGPLTERNYQKAALQDNPVFSDPLAGSMLDGGASGNNGLPAYDPADYYARSMTYCCNMYKGDGSVLDAAIAKLAAKRFLDYMSSPDRTDEGFIRVLRALQLPGFYAEITKDSEVQHGDMPWLADRWKGLDIFCTSHVEKGDPDCMKYGKDAQFVLQIFLE